MMSFFGGYDTEENTYPLELLNEDIDKMLNSDEIISAFNALKSVDNENEDNELNAAEKVCEMVCTYDSVDRHYGYDTEDNTYPLELLNEDIDKMLNSDEIISAFNVLKWKMEKEEKEADKEEKETDN